MSLIAREVSILPALSFYDGYYIPTYLRIFLRNTAVDIISCQIKEINENERHVIYKVLVNPNGIEKLIAQLYEGIDQVLFNEAATRQILTHLWNIYETRGLLYKNLCTIHLLYGDSYQIYYYDATGGFDNFTLPFCHDYMLLLENILLNENESGVPKKFKRAFLITFQEICYFFGRAILYLVEKAKERTIRSQMDYQENSFQITS